MDYSDYADSAKFWARSMSNWHFIAQMDMLLGHLESAIQAQEKAANAYKKMDFFRNRLEKAV